MFGLLRKRIMYIDVCIPYDEEGRLARAYNRALADGISEWVLFLDHDVFLCNPYWYEMCMEAIEKLRQDPKAACVGCECGGEHLAKEKRQQGRDYIQPNGNIDHHIQHSKMMYHKHGNMLEQIRVSVPGYFILLKRELAREIGFVQRKRSINNIDTDFGGRLMKAGYHIYNMPGLYVYHRRGMKHLKKEFKIKDNET